MKTKNLFAFLSSLLLLFTVGCSKENNEPILKSTDITLEVSMPENISVQDIKGSFAYYWSQEMTLAYTLEQDGKAVLSDRITPVSIAAEGGLATFRISSLEDGIDPNKPVSIRGTVTSESGDKFEVGGGTLHLPQDWTGTLPYNLLSGINLPMTTSGEGELVEGKGKINLTLEPQGKIILLQVNNTTADYLRLKSFALSSDKEVFPNDKALFSTETSAFEGKVSKTSASFAFQENDDFDSNVSKTYILWIPADKDLGSVDMTMDCQKRIVVDETTGFEDNSYKSNKSFVITQDKNLIVVNIIPKQLLLSDQPSILPADITNGGDPFFSMDDIKYWVGEGSNRSALVIEWHDGKSPDALVWGYKWDGKKTGEDMIKAIVKADPRLSILSGMGIVAGIGYQFTPTTPRASIMQGDQALPNDGNGTTPINNYEGIDDLTFSDPKGHWVSGWMKNGYWSFHTKSDRMGKWGYSNSGFSSRGLSDGSWDGWSFQRGWTNWTGQPLGNTFHAVTSPNN